MTNSSGRKPIAAVCAVLLAVALVVYFTGTSRAQYSGNSFISLIKPYLNEEVQISSGGQTYPATIVDIGSDYITFRDHWEVKTAVPLYVITSVQFTDKPVIRLTF